MATNNYFGFAHGGTQYGASPAGATYPTAQTGYAVAPAATAATYGAQRPAYDQAYQVQAAATQGTYASAATPAVTYDYGYGRTQTYDTTKTYYQQAAAPTTATYAAAAQTYDASQNAATKVTGYQTAQYVAAPTRNNIQPAKAAAAAATYTNPTYVPQTTYSQTVQSNVNTAPKQAVATTNPSTYSNYDAALYSAATMYVAQQNKSTGQTATWPNYKKTTTHTGTIKQPRLKPQPKPQQLHYCDVCKISCAGPQTYREHLEGQKHKKREASLKMAATAAASQNRGNNLHCELCDVTCTGNDAYAAHVRGAKHQKVVKLHQKLGKPIPSADPLAKKAKINFVQAGAGTGTTSSTATATTTTTTTTVDGKETTTTTTAATTNDTTESLDDDSGQMDEIKPVGVEYIDEIKDDDGKILSFNCKLCECKFNDPNAKEMHMKGRRHRLQYKKKVQPDLIVDFKNAGRQRKIHEAKQQRALMQVEYWNRHRNAMIEDGEDDNMYWDERRRYEDEYDYMAWMQRGAGSGGGGGGSGYSRGGPHLRSGLPINHLFFGMIPGRRPESSDDRHVVARHAEIYPKEEELQTIQRIVSHTERALKFVSDELAEKSTNASVLKSSDKRDTDKEIKKEDGRDNQMFSFQKDAEGNARILKGVMRVGLLAKGLLLQGDTLVELVVLCAEKPTNAVLKLVLAELPVQLKDVSDDYKYTVTMEPDKGAILVTDSTITVKVSMTSPLLREQQDSNNAAPQTESVQSSEDLLPREPCLQALAALRHAKWFQARATGLQSCVMVMRIFRDLCQRVPTWTPLNQWAMELLIEKVISSAGVPLSPGDCIRRIMESISTGLLINGPGLLDPCEKEPRDALHGLSKQQREDLTVSSQQFLRYIAFRQIHKVLGMDQLPAPKFQQRTWRYTRKRRRSGAEPNESEADGNKMVKKEKPEADKMET